MTTPELLLIRNHTHSIACLSSLGFLPALCSEFPLSCCVSLSFLQLLLKVHRGGIPSSSPAISQPCPFKAGHSHSLLLPQSSVLYLHWGSHANNILLLFLKFSNNCFRVSSEMDLVYALTLCFLGSRLNHGLLRAACCLQRCWPFLRHEGSGKHCKLEASPKCAMSTSGQDSSY